MHENEDNAHNAEEVDDHQKKKRGVDDWDDALHEVHDSGDTLDDVQNVQVDLAVAVGWECHPFSGSPSDGPSSELSLAPSANPSLLLSLSPTRYPTPKPSSSPSVGPSSLPMLFYSPSIICRDTHEKFQFGNPSNMKTCFYVSKNAAERCEEDGVKNHCKVTCGHDCVPSDNDEEFTGGSGIARNCAWVGENPSVRCFWNILRSNCPVTCSGYSYTVPFVEY